MKWIESVPGGVLRGIDTMRFTTELLPLLTDLPDDRLLSAGDMEDHRRPALRAIEYRFRIDSRFEEARSVQESLNGDRASIDGVEREDIAEMERELACCAFTVGVAEAFEADRIDAVVHEQRKRQRHSLGARRAVDADVAEVPG